VEATAVVEATAATKAPMARHTALKDPLQRTGPIW